MISRATHRDRTCRMAFTSRQSALGSFSLPDTLRGLTLEVPLAASPVPRFSNRVFMDVRLLLTFLLMGLAAFRMPFTSTQTPLTPIRTPLTLVRLMDTALRTPLAAFLAPLPLVLLMIAPFRARLTSFRTHLAPFRTHLTLVRLMDAPLRPRLAGFRSWLTRPRKLSTIFLTLAS